MTSRLRLRSSAASNISSRTAFLGHYAISSQRSSQERPKRANLVRTYGPYLGKRTALNAHRHESLCQHASRRHKIVRAIGAVARFSYIPVSLLSFCHVRADALAFAVRDPLPVRTVSRGHRNRAPAEFHTFCTTAPQPNHMPRSMPSYILAKSRVVVDRAADVMRGRGVPSSRQDLQDLQEAEAEAERKTKEGEEIRLKKIRLEAIRLQTITEARLQKTGQQRNMKRNASGSTSKA
jgi:hypothetical protein